MEFFSCLSDIEWELIHVNSKLIIAKIHEVEEAKRAAKREQELITLAEFQTMELKMMLEEKEAVLMEKAQEEAEQTRERIELAEFEMLERQFENEEKLTALKKELLEERSCRQSLLLAQQQKGRESSLEKTHVTTSSSVHYQQQRYQTTVDIKSPEERYSTGILSSNNNNNNNNVIVKKVRFADSVTALVPGIRRVEQHKVVAGVVNNIKNSTIPRKGKPISSKIPTLFKAARRRSQ